MNGIWHTCSAARMQCHDSNCVRNYPRATNVPPCRYSNGSWKQIACFQKWTISTRNLNLLQLWKDFFYNFNIQLNEANLVWYNPPRFEKRLEPLASSHCFCPLYSMKERNEPERDEDRYRDDIGGVE